MDSDIIKVNTEETIKRAKDVYLLAEIFESKTDKGFIAAVRSCAKELERTAMLLRETVRHVAALRGEPKPLIATNVHGIGKCPSCGEDLCSDDETLRFCPTCGIAVKPEEVGA